MNYLENSYNKILKNEYLIKANRLKRLNITSESPIYFAINKTSSRAIFINISYIIGYYALSIINIISLILLPKKDLCCENTAFIYTDKRLLKFTPETVQSYLIGLHKPPKKTHAYRTLTKAEIFTCILNSIKSKEKYRANSLFHLNKIRKIDFQLASTFISKHCEIYTAGHFDVYTSIASLLREKSIISRLNGQQHGLFEKFTPAVPNKLFFDTFKLLFVESKKYFNYYLSANPQCIISYNGIFFSPEFIFPFKEEKTFVLAYALQDDDYQSDLQNVTHITSCIKGKNIKLIIYPHPNNRYTTLKELSFTDNIYIYPTDRHKNIDAIITRYSTIGIDYAKIGIPAIYLASQDSVCIFDGNNALINVIRNHDELDKIIDDLFKKAQN